MRVAVVGLDAADAERIAGWLGDEGHLPRREAPTVADLTRYEAVVCEAALADTLTERFGLPVIGIASADADGASAARETRLKKPLRRRALLAALDAAVGRHG